jgi:hypothetical protein
MCVVIRKRLYEGTAGRRYTFNGYSCLIGARCQNLDSPTNRGRRLKRVHKRAQITSMSPRQRDKRADKKALALLQFVASWDAEEAELGPEGLEYLTETRASVSTNSVDDVRVESPSSHAIIFALTSGHIIGRRFEHRNGEGDATAVENGVCQWKISGTAVW